MSTWYYYDSNGQKQGPITGGQLKGLAKTGRITSDTIVETEHGKKARAGKVKGLTFIMPEATHSEPTPLEPAQPVEAEAYGLAAPPPPPSPFIASMLEAVEMPNTTPPILPEPVVENPFAIPMPETVSTSVSDTSEAENPFAVSMPVMEVSDSPFTAPSPFIQAAQASPSSGNVFCTNCGNSVSEQAVACMSCGAAPVGHRKFCRSCGAALNPEQVVCIRCGAGISVGGVSRNVAGGTRAGTSWQKNKLVAGLLGILIGGIGAHKYYMGSWGWGIVFTAVCILSMGFLGFIPAIIGLVEGIMFLVMSEETFADKYPSETESPFRW